jgi:hypothetical protein
VCTLSTSRSNTFWESARPKDKSDTLALLLLVVI